MFIKGQRGLAGIDISISIIIITIFISIIANLITNINMNFKDTQRKTIAISYAIKEIEKIKGRGYKEEYNNKGIDNEYIIEENDILDSKEEFTGYHKKILIKDYVLITNDNTKKQDLVKEVTIEISYKLGKESKSISISTYITRI